MKGKDKTAPNSGHIIPGSKYITPNSEHIVFNPEHITPSSEVLTPNSEVAIKCSNLTKVYPMYSNPKDRFKEALHPLRKKYHKDFYALNDVSFEIKKGETVGIIGKNGAGKSTLLKIITGVLTPTSGTVEVKGKIASLLELGAGFNMEMTGIENIYLNGSIRGYSKEEIDQKLESIVSFADIGEHIHQPVRGYSSGMFARLAFSVAINVDPDILIVDEALSVGDFAFQYKCFMKFKEFQTMGRTILFVTHSMQETVRYCNRAILVHSGEALLDSYNTEEVVFEYETLVRNSDKVYNVSPLKEDGSEHRFGTHDALIESVSFMQGDSSHLLSGVSTEIKLKINSKKQLQNLVIGYSLKNIKGVVVWGDSSLSGKNEYFELSEGKYELIIKFDANVVPGEYYFYVGLSSFRSKKIDIDQRWRCEKIVFQSKRHMSEGLVYAPSNIEIFKEKRS